MLYTGRLFLLSSSRIYLNFRAGLTLATFPFSLDSLRHAAQGTGVPHEFPEYLGFRMVPYTFRAQPRSRFSLYTWRAAKSSP